MRRLYLILAILALASCGKQGEHFVIGVSQCSEDAWRGKLKSELEMANFFHDGIELRFVSAHDDSQLQEKQVDSLVAQGIDLLIISPNQQTQLLPSIERAFDSGIPVILFDRKIASEKYTSFMGVDNFEIGKLLGQYAGENLAKGSKLIEIKGLEDSSPANERHNGFISAIRSYPQIQIVGEAHGDWTRESGYKAMESILSAYDGPVDCIMGGNDRMAEGALEALRRHRPDARPMVLGVDALPGKGEGIQLVRDSILTASAIYPTHGDELLDLAVSILNSRSCLKEYIMPTSLVTSGNARILLLQNEELERSNKSIRQAKKQIENIRIAMNNQQMLLLSVVAILLISLISIIIIAREYRKNKRLSQILAEQKEIAEAQRDELELERDRLIEAQLANRESNEVNEILSGREEIFRAENEFMQRFKNVLKDNLSNEEFGVEQIGAELGYSRVQLYRKVKAMTGKSPVEFIRSTRLAYAKLMLSDSSLSVSEVAYRVGFSSPSYFSKCFKEEFGSLPSNN
ncbi:MAG: substrate-binding domain-containing protein [Bacteroidales bacterium]|nr:substrate-binding domain-containing protein [Candidatus Cryptobacteroides equifaecalis]